MEGNGKERIYVGGLDPDRGLTVDLVASRLRSVEGVEVLSINDVSIKNSKKRHNAVEDGYGESASSGNFFFLEARASDAAPALHLIAKQYNGVSWKGCRLRVEAARPHFLKRLEVERELRANKKKRLEEEPYLRSRKQLGHDRPIVCHETPHDRTKGGEIVVKDRRWLRIRRRYGEEAFHVDTHPRPLEISRQARRGEGWDEFAFLHKRLHNKRLSQQKKLVEMRKKERRLWSSGKGSGRKGPTSSDGTDGMRSLMFLNRGIHVRFCDALIPGAGEKQVIKEAADSAKNDADSEDSITSSSIVSSDSDKFSEYDTNTKGGKGVYVWSDDEDDDDDSDDKENVSQSDVSSEQNDHSSDEERKSEGERARSNDGDDYGNGYTRDGHLTSNVQAVSMNEFCDGMDFDHAADSADELASGGGVNDYDLDRVDDDVSQYCIDDDDIRSNMGILSNLFPRESFDRRPLAASIAGSGGDGDDEEGTKDRGIGETSPAFGSGLIMQRYDPTKESDKRFERPRANKTNSSNCGKPKPPSVHETDKSTGKENTSSVEDASTSSESLKEVDDVQQASHTDVDNTSSEMPFNADGEVVPARDIHDPDGPVGKFEQSQEEKVYSPANPSRKEDKIEEPLKEEIVEGDVYEQDKLEDVFKRARGDGSDDAGAGGFAFGFQDQLLDSGTVDGGGVPFSFGFDIGNPSRKEKGQLPDSEAADGGSAPFSFGFDLSNPSKNNKVRSSPQTRPEQRSDDRECEAHAVQAPPTMKLKEKQKSGSPRRKRRGMQFPEEDLDKYQDMFFGLNEGPQILRDLDAMRQDKESQEQWQKERVILTADWKSKQKRVLSRKGKRGRR